MKVQGLWTEHVPLTLEHAQNHMDKEINELLEMVDATRLHDTVYYVFERSIYQQLIQGKEFADWLYDYSESTLRDIKKELSIKIERSINSPPSIAENFELMLMQPDTFLISKDTIIKNHVWSRKDYLKAKRCFLSNRHTKALFVQEIRECFDNIFFTHAVDTSMNSLNNEFNNIKLEIIEHLTKLDEFTKEFKRLQCQNASNECMSLAFKEFSGIDCSPQSDRASAHKLRRDFYNTDTKVDEELCCELHTKFKKHMRDVKNQDRIYFHPGRQGVHEGRLLIIHIGTHQ